MFLRHGIRAKQQHLGPVPRVQVRAGQARIADAQSVEDRRARVVADVPSTLRTDRHEAVAHVPQEIVHEMRGGGVLSVTRGDVQLAEEDKPVAAAVFKKRRIGEIEAAVDDRAEVAARGLLDRVAAHDAAIAAFPFRTRIVRRPLVRQDKGRHHVRSAAPVMQVFVRKAVEIGALGQPHKSVARTRRHHLEARQRAGLLFEDEHLKPVVNRARRLHGTQEGVRAVQSEAADNQQTGVRKVFGLHDPAEREARRFQNGRRPPHRIVEGAGDVLPFRPRDGRPELEFRLVRLHQPPVRRDDLDLKRPRRARQHRGCRERYRLLLDAARRDRKREVALRGGRVPRAHLPPAGQLARRDMIVDGNDALHDLLAGEVRMVLVGEVLRVARQEDEQRRIDLADRLMEIVGKRIVRQRMPLNLVRAVRAVRLQADRLHVVRPIPDDILSHERVRRQHQVARTGEVAQPVHAVRPPRLDDAQMVRRRQVALVRVQGAHDRLRPFAEIRHGIRLASVNRVAEIPRGMFGDQRAQLRVVEVHELRRIGEARFHHHQRLRVTRRPLGGPVLLLLQRRAVALVVHGREDPAAVAARVLEALTARIDRPHDPLRRLDAHTRVPLPRRIVLRVVQLRRILVPRIAAGVEVRVPHDDGRMVAVAVQELFDIRPVGSQVFVFIRRHRKEVVEPHRVTRRQIGRPADLRGLADRIVPDRIVVHFLDVRDILPDGLVRTVVVAHAVESGACPHPEPRVHAVEEKLAVLDPHLAEAERARRQGIDRLAVLHERDAHLVDVRRLDIPEDGILPRRVPDEPLLRRTVQRNVLRRREADLAVADEVKPDLHLPRQARGIVQPRPQRHTFRAVGRQRNSRLERHPAGRRLQPDVAERDLAVVADRHFAAPKPDVVAVDIDGKDVHASVFRQTVRDVQTTGVRHIRMNLVAPPESADLRPVQVDAPRVAVQVLEIEPHARTRRRLRRRESALIPRRTVGFVHPVAIDMRNLLGNLPVFKRVIAPQRRTEAPRHAHVPPVAARRRKREVVRGLNAPVAVERHAAPCAVRAPLGVRQVPQRVLAARRRKRVAMRQEGEPSHLLRRHEPDALRARRLREVGERPLERQTPLFGAGDLPDERAVRTGERHRRRHAQVEGVGAFQRVRLPFRLHHEPKPPGRAHRRQRQAAAACLSRAVKPDQVLRARQAVRPEREGELRARRGDGLQRSRTALRDKLEDLRLGKRRVIDADVVIDAVARLRLEAVARPVAAGQNHRRARFGIAERVLVRTPRDRLAVGVQDHLARRGAPRKGHVRPGVLLEHALLEQLYLPRRDDRQLDGSALPFHEVEPERLPALFARTDNRVAARLVLRPMRLEPEGHRPRLCRHVPDRIDDEARRLVIGVPPDVQPLSRDALRPRLASVDDALRRGRPRPHHGLARTVQRKDA